MATTEKSTQAWKSKWKNLSKQQKSKNRNHQSKSESQKIDPEVAMYK